MPHLAPPKSPHWDLSGGTGLPEVIAGRIVYQLRQGLTVTVRVSPGTDAERKLCRLFHGKARQVERGCWEITA